MKLNRKSRWMGTGWRTRGGRFGIVPAVDPTTLIDNRAPAELIDGQRAVKNESRAIFFLPSHVRPLPPMNVLRTSLPAANYVIKNFFSLVLELLHDVVPSWNSRY